MSGEIRIALLVGKGSRVPGILRCVENLHNAKVVYVLSCIGEGIGTETAKRHQIKTGVLAWEDYKRFKNGRNNFSARARNLLKSYQADLVVMAGWMIVMPASFVREFAGRIVNIHPSILPAYPGKAENVIPKQWRDKAVPVGCTLHYVDEGMDTGKSILRGCIVRKLADYKKFSSFEEFEAAIHAKEDEVLCEGIRNIVKEWKF